MPVLVFAIILLIVVGLLMYLVDLLPMDARLKLGAKILIILVAILLLIDRSGAV